MSVRLGHCLAGKVADFTLNLNINVTYYLILFSGAAHRTK